MKFVGNNRLRRNVYLEPVDVREVPLVANVVDMPATRDEQWSCLHAVDARNPESHLSRKTKPFADEAIREGLCV